MKIAIAGTRGIPANYGGFETFAEELSIRLAARGHAVRVYCRQTPPSSPYRGVELVELPTIHHKYFDTLAHTFVTTLHLLLHRQDIALYCNGANAIFTILPRMLGLPVALNVDGLERKRKKWNALARAWYLLSEWLATFLPTAVITDAKTIQDYYQERYGKDSVFIPYGAPVGRLPTSAILRELGLQPGRYFLYVSRMEPENNALLVRQAFEGVSTDFQLVLVGDAPHAHDYIKQVRDTADKRVIIPGAIYGAGYHELQSHCFAYIHATEVGGTHPALIEGMGRGALTLCLENPENNEVAGGVSIPFQPATLTEAMNKAIAMNEADRELLRNAAMLRVRERYSWDAVTDAYEKLFKLLTR